jgi:hypothetical protein
MATNPFQFNYQPPEYNPRGDYANGVQGGLTGASQMQQAANRQGGSTTGSNAFEGMLQHAINLNSAGKPQQVGGAPAPTGRRRAVGVPSNGNPFPSGFPAGAPQPGTYAPPQSPQPGTQDGGNLSGYNPMFQTPVNVPLVNQTGPQAWDGAQNVPVTPPTSDVPAAGSATMNQVPTPEMWGRYENFPEAPAGQTPSPVGDPSVPPPAAPPVTPPPTTPPPPPRQPGQGPGGNNPASDPVPPSDTGNDGADEGYFEQKAREYSSYDGPWKGKVTPQDVKDYHAYSAAVEAAGLRTQHFTVWWENGKVTADKFKDDMAGITRTRQTGRNSTGRGNEAPTDPRLPTNNGGGGGTGGSGSGTGGTGSGNPSDPTRPPGTPPPAQPNLTNFNDVLNTVIGEVSQRYNPMFQQQQGDLQRQLQQSAAVSGALNSGGFGATAGKAMNQLMGQQGQQLGQEISEQTKNYSQLAMQKYVTEINAAVQQEQIRTNADLERYAQDLQKYGIDKNDLLARYQSQLALKGQMYSADRSVDAAALHAAASQAAAAASAQASMYAANLGYQSDLMRGDISREQNIMQFILGAYALGPDWARLILQSGPEGMFGNVPGDVVVRP